ncbi:hypothetical protein QYE76_026037 [Lolium multiflorum]|uniref:Uncharacterized protein n=1 Tax=Lolium multiflorum TaxID=4521 RepID=A0AAD8RFI3_LOLMU|nr:hypothetical protein QYE76_026037 [Lolium multiflorum]
MPTRKKVFWLGSSPDSVAGSLTSATAAARSPAPTWLAHGCRDALRLPPPASPPGSIGMATAAMTAMTPPVSLSSLSGSSLPQPKPAVCWITNHPPWLQLQQRHGQLDILYRNSGTYGSSAHAPLVALDLADFDRVMVANTRSKVAGVKHATCLMVP